MRDRILGRVRAALSDTPRVRHPGEAPVGGAGAGGGADTPAGDRPSDVADRFEAAFRAAGGEVMRFRSPVEARVWAEGLVDDGPVCESPLVPPDLRLYTGRCSPADARTGVSMALWAAADTGTLVLGASEGRRLQLLPPVHLVWVPANRVVPSLAEALAEGREDGGSALALHSGPSKSADIGQILVTGVHGPARVMAALVEGVPRPPGAATGG